ncbi:MAG: nucleotidyltransferase domain-containing protein [Candidatus Hodarchaeales archaeon]
MIKARFEKAEELQHQALGVIEEIGLLTKWEQVGKPILVGSVRFGLMTKQSDIDLEIYVERPDIKTGFEVIQKFALLPGVKKVRYSNELKTIHEGLYWRIDYVDEKSIAWSIDNWMLSHSHPHAGVADKFARAMEKALTLENRHRILEIKANIPPELETRRRDVYKAVLRDDIETFYEFQEWIKDNPPVEIEHWRP